MDTLELCEAQGVKTIITNPISGGVINRYWSERGGGIQWIVEGHPREKDIESGIQESLDAGASAAYIQGVIGDRWTKEGRLDLIAETVEFIKKNKVPAGVGAHSLDVVVTCEEAGINPDFYVKTLHTSDYWSARRNDQHDDVISNRADNYWSMTPEKTIEFMKRVEKPWIAFKVLAAGAIHPRKGMAYAFENGADFCCVGMFDFQVREDAKIARDTLSHILDRDRPWRA